MLCRIPLRGRRVAGEWVTTSGNPNSVANDSGKTSCNANSDAFRPDDAGGGTDDDCAGRYIVRDNGSSSDHCVIADRDSFQDERAGTDPHPVADSHRTDVPSTAWYGVLICVENHNIPANLTVLADRHFLPRDNLHIAVEEGARADGEAGTLAHLEPRPRVEEAVANFDDPT